MNDPKDIGKLPKWAQEYVKNLERERDVAIQTLNEFTDNQTKAPFRYEEWICTGEKKGPSIKTRYIQTNEMKIEHAGVKVSILLVRPDDGQRDYGVEVLAEPCEQHKHRLASFVPRQGGFVIQAPSNMIRQP